MKCENEKCNNERKTLFRSKSKRYKLYICGECKSKEENDSENADKAKLGGKNGD